MSSATEAVKSLDSATMINPLGRIDQLLERISEKFNPILVKEARQALKSRQFIVTFAILLLAAWIWSLIGVSMLMPGVYFVPSGPFMLVGYCLVLAVPMLLVVPYSAFWSLARERDDQTFELMSITALSAHQIVTGKLGSAVVQIVVYYSALAPCIAFTYLLRGIDVLTIALVLLGTFTLSVLLCLVGLVLAALSQVRHWQMLLSVAYLLGLAMVGLYWMIIMFAMISQPVEFDSGDFWIIVLAILSGAASFYVLLVRLAAAQISFASDNRSTPVRQAMLAQLAVFTGWCGYVFFRSFEIELLFATLVLGSMVWMFYSMLISGETARLSPRAKRKLPQSLLARSFFTWMNPGAETGYIFSVASFSAFILLVVSWYLWATSNDLMAGHGDLLLFALLLWGYFVFYLGLGRILVAWLGKFMTSSFLLALSVYGLLLVASSLGPTFLQSWLEGFNSLDYSTLQTPNWCWTLVAAANGDLGRNSEVPLLMTLAAAMMLVLRLRRAAAEVRHVRALVPQRVAEDDAGK